MRAGFPGILYDYSGQGQLLRVSIDAGSEQRTLSYGYDDLGYLDFIEKSVRTILLKNDALGRSNAQVLRELPRIELDNDLNSNQTALTPPSGDPHGFGYNELDAVTAYSPPGAPDNSTPALPPIILPNQRSQ